MLYEPFVDIKKAFDTVLYDTIIKKLEHYGTRDIKKTGSYHI